MIGTAEKFYTRKNTDLSDNKKSPAHSRTLFNTKFLSENKRHRPYKSYYGDDKNNRHNHRTRNSGLIFGRTMIDFRKKHDNGAYKHNQRNHGAHSASHRHKRVEKRYVIGRAGQKQRHKQQYSGGGNNYFWNLVLIYFQHLIILLHSDDFVNGFLFVRRFIVFFCQNIINFHKVIGKRRPKRHDFAA